MEGHAIEAHKRQFQEFFESPEYGGKYIQKLKDCIADEKFRLIVNINDIRSFDRDLAAEIIRKPREYILSLQEVAAETAQNADPSLLKLLKANELQIGFEGSFGTHSVSPRSLVSSLLNQLVTIEGIVTKCSTVRPKLVRSVHFCPATKSYLTREYRDATAMDLGIAIRGRERMPTSSSFPTHDDQGNPLETEHGLCQYKDYQTIILQEMPERARVGQLPRSVEMIVEHDLVDKLKPGDRAQCVGVYRALGSVQNGTSSGIFRSVLLCNNVSVIGKEVGAVRLTGEDVQHIREISSRPDVLDTLASSLCPSIFGHEFVKRAIILQLLGGSERNLANGTHLRGDINMMMVGDPSTAKSQLLRAVMDIAPLAISTTGRGSSGVGLTAAVTSDADTGERRLEAGAMVLADRGVVCIDEFDKMSENDRVAIHEVMEQQTVTIAKAGIHASLNARCSVVAAANPVYGQYDRTRRPQDNIGLPDSLLSRFDLLFIVLDQLDPVLDRRLADHVIKSHQYRRAGSTMEPEPLNQAASLCLDEVGEVAKETVVWHRGGRGAGGADLLTKDFLRKYIHYAKNRIHPVLSDVAMESISNAYAEMRGKQTPKNLPVTARSLETLIRLSSAHAKARLSTHVEDVDVDVAVGLINFVLFHEIGDYHNVEEHVRAAAPIITTAPKSRKRSSIGDDTSDESDDDLMPKKSRAALLDEPEEEPEPVMVSKTSSNYMRTVSMIQKLAAAGEDEIHLDVVRRRLNEGISAISKDYMSSKELEAILLSMERDNKVKFIANE